MKPLPRVDTSYKALYDLVMAPLRSRLLMVAIDLGIFDHMDGFRPAGDIAAAIGTHADNTKRFLDALTTIGLVEKRAGLYRNGSEAAAFLVKNSPTDLSPFFHLVQKICVDPLNDLAEWVKDGPCLETCAEDFSSESLLAEMTRASAGWVTGGVGQKMARIVSGLPEFIGFRKMLDLGGGHGMFALYFVVAHPHMTGVVFDRPSVVPVAEAFIQEYGLQNRVSVKAGDFMTDDIGTGYDFVWASSTLNFARFDLDPVFSKIFGALNPDGVFISFQDGMTHEKTRPATMLGHLADAMRMGRDLSFDQGEICQAMLRNGFRTVRSRTVATPVGEMDLDIARK